MVLFKFAIVFLLSVLPSAASECASSTRPGEDSGEQSEKTERGTTKFLRKLNENDKGKEKEDDKGIKIAAVGGRETGDGDGTVSNFIRSRPDQTAWNHGSSAVSAFKTGDIAIDYPADTEVGDTVFLFLSRTDGFLPLRISNTGINISNTKWNRGAECFKTYNKVPKCMRSTNCIEWEGEYCRKFSRGGKTGTGKDLATVMFYRQVTNNDPMSLKLHIRGGTTTWAVITSITNVNQEDPIRSVSETSCDLAKDSVFPSVFGKENDVLLLSQSFDDSAVKSQFRRPVGTIRLGYTRSIDEAGFLFGEKLDHTGKTGELTTRGDGGGTCKDALLSVVVNRN